MSMPALAPQRTVLAPEDRRVKVLGAILSVRERAEIEAALLAAGYRKPDGGVHPGHGAREVLLAWSRGLLIPINPPAGARLLPQRPVFPEGTAP